MIFGTFLIAGGAVLIALFGIVPEPTHSLEDLIRLFSRKTFIVYFSLLGVFLGIALIITHIAESRIPVEFIYDSPGTETVPLPRQSDGGSHQLEVPGAARTTERTPLLVLDNKSQTSLSAIAAHEKRISRTKLWVAISYASASGIQSGMCLLFAKSSVELLVLTFSGNNQFFRWESWALLCGLIVFALLQLLYLHKSLVLANPTLVCPLAFCFYNISSIFNGLVYFDQLALLSVLKLSMVLVGMTILLLGVWAVSIQPGSDTRVEVGTWQEGTELLTSEIVGTESVVISGGQGVNTTESSGTSPTIRPRSIYTRGTTTSGGGIPTLILSTSPDSARAEPERDESISPLPQDRHPSGSTSTSTPFPSLIRSPTRASRAGMYGDIGHGPLSPASPDGQSQSRGHGLRPRRKWSSIFEGQGGTTAGLSIGLSATSPGFAVIPTERRRVSSATYSVDSQGRGRRTLSESDVLRRGSLGSPRHAERASFGEEAIGGYGSTQATEQRPSDSDKGRWRWLRGIFNL
ncbi:hypothetical protein FRC17_006648 [Serendipita sp. 399]|nr:hypothetical protein FRC17_006648 [Serendipita sp. 399]